MSFSPHVNFFFVFITIPLFRNFSHALFIAQQFGFIYRRIFFATKKWEVFKIKLRWKWKQSKKMQIFFAVIWFPQTVGFVTFMWSNIITTTFSLINHKAVITGFVRDFHSYSDDDEEHSKTLCHIMTNHLRMIRLHR